MDEETVKILAELISGLEETVKRVREELTKYIEKEIIWRIINSPKPVSLEDPAIRWMLKKLETIKEKHPSVQIEFLKDANGLITGLKYSAENEEIAMDVESLATWAFSKAASRPLAKQEGGGETKA
ncbi:MAG: hypothetical protein QW341_01960 [Candidatus Bathyarchaeia archaeon]